MLLLSARELLRRLQQRTAFQNQQQIAHFQERQVARLGGTVQRVLHALHERLPLKDPREGVTYIGAS